MKRITILSDYTSEEKPNLLTIILDDQGDIHISMHKDTDDERGVRLATSGSRHKSKRVWKAFRELIEAYEEELQDEFCHPALREFNHREMKTE